MAEVILLLSLLYGRNRMEFFVIVINYWKQNVFPAKIAADRGHPQLTSYTFRKKIYPIPMALFFQTNTMEFDTKFLDNTVWVRGE